MPAQTIVDLDVVAGADRKVRVGGVIYKLPADCPVDLYLKLKHYGDQGELDDADVVEDLYGELLLLFRYRQPELERLPIGVTALLEAIPRIYTPEAVEEDGERPTKAGTTRKSTARRKKSPSSS